MALKLCVGEAFTDRPLNRELFVAGYVNGSTRGAAAVLLTYMLTQCSKRAFDVPQVRAFLLSASRLKATFVVYSDGRLRARVAWRAAPRPIGSATAGLPRHTQRNSCFFGLQAQAARK